MKKFESLGRSLSKGEQKKIMGGDDENLAQCTVRCTCSGHSAIDAHCPSNISSCSATDEVSITCDTWTQSCSYICSNY